VELQDLLTLMQFLNAARSSILMALSPLDGTETITHFENGKLAHYCI